MSLHRLLAGIPSIETKRIVSKPPAIENPSLRPVYISEAKPAQVQMGAAIEREATAVLKDAEQLARVDTIEELVALLIFTFIALLGIWILYRLDSAPVWDLSKID